MGWHYNKGKNDDEKEYGYQGDTYIVEGGARWHVRKRKMKMILKH
jgi:hypothetical protein